MTKALAYQSQNSLLKLVASHELIDSSHDIEDVFYFLSLSIND